VRRGVRVGFLLQLREEKKRGSQVRRYPNQGAQKGNSEQVTVKSFPRGNEQVQGGRYLEGRGTLRKIGAASSAFLILNNKEKMTRDGKIVGKKVHKRFGRGRGGKIGHGATI